jgi:hypothetical protein
MCCYISDSKDTSHQEKGSPHNRLKPYLGENAPTWLSTVHAEDDPAGTVESTDIFRDPVDTSLPTIPEEEERQDRQSAEDEEFTADPPEILNNTDEMLMAGDQPSIEEDEQGYEADSYTDSAEAIEEEYEVERMIKTRHTEEGQQYFVKWKNFPEKTNSWISIDAVNEALLDYLRNNPIPTTRRGRPKGPKTTEIKYRKLNTRCIKSCK